MNSTIFLGLNKLLKSILIDNDLCIEISSLEFICIVCVLDGGSRFVTFVYLYLNVFGLRVIDDNIYGLFAGKLHRVLKIEY